MVEAVVILFITEIMYNPNAFEGNSEQQVPNRVEWVEIYNAGDAAIDLAGYHLQDEDGATGPIAQGTMIEPGQAMVIYSDQAIAGTGEDKFKGAWGDDVPAVAVANWTEGLKNLANNPSLTNEMLTLRDAAGGVVDMVNYDDEGDWPASKPGGASITLKSSAVTTEGATANDLGANWQRSQEGVDGVFASQMNDMFDRVDLGSPGKVK